MGFIHKNEVKVTRKMPAINSGSIKFRYLKIKFDLYYINLKVIKKYKSKQI
jgi:hypothetical protein